MISRRRFLQNSALVSLSPWIPAFLPTTLKAAEAQKDGRLLVVIQLDGGNDGLNTVIPFSDENYGKNRPELRIADKNIIKLNDSIGLHPGMKAAADLYHDGRFSIVQGVGYPNPNRSHFESMAIWHQAWAETRERNDGWLGRAVMTIPRRDTAVPDSVFVGNDAVPLALRGRRANAVSLERESDLQLLRPVPSASSPSSGDDLRAFITRTQDSSFQAARQFDQSAGSKGDTASYPGTGLAKRLQLVSRLIKMGGGTRVFYTSQSGYDTHAGQANSHRVLLNEFSGALSAFLDDLKASQLADRVMVLAFSEFGRRVSENGSAGTDHGAAGPVFVAGSPVRPGLVGDHPSLSDLDQGDLKMSIDFRSVYATILSDWLGIDATPILGKVFNTVPLVKA